VLAFGTFDVWKSEWRAAGIGVAQVFGFEHRGVVYKLGTKIRGLGWKGDRIFRDMY
jgi:D-arabinose 1-dehydrogenase-like Zn-dependent alcohol dehydrogenase